MIDLNGKVISINDIGILKFMYPDYDIVNEPVMFADRGIIYNGPDKYVSFIRNMGVPYMILRKIGEYDLDKRELLLEVAYSKFGKSVPKYMFDEVSYTKNKFYEEFSDEEFIDLFKILWVTGSWVKKDLDKNTKFYELVMNLSSGVKGRLKYTLGLLETCDPEVVSDMLLNLLVKIKTQEDKTGSKYQSSVNNLRKSIGKNMSKLVERILKCNIENKELYIINMVEFIMSSV